MFAYILLLALAGYISSSDMGHFVKSDGEVSLDANISSEDTPGSFDFNAGIHTNLDHVSQSAFYALIDNYYAHNVSYRTNGITYATYNPTIQDGYISTDHAFVTVTNNALVNYDTLLGCMERITDASGSSYSGPFKDTDDRTSSSAFDALYGNLWSNHNFRAVTDLVPWRSLAVLGNLTNSSAFRFSTSYNRNRHVLYNMLNSVCFHEYMYESNMVADILYDYNQNRPSACRFEDLADALWTTNDICQVTNRSYSLSLKPLEAAAQTLALMDSYVYNEADFWNNNEKGRFVSQNEYSYRREATDECCGTASFKISENGELVDVVAPSHPTPSTTLSDVETTVKHPKYTHREYSVRVSGVSHRAEVGCVTNVISENSIEVDVSQAFHETIGYPSESTNMTLWVCCNNANWEGFPYFYGDIICKVDETEVTYGYSMSCNVSDIVKSYEAPIFGIVVASYGITEDDISSWTNAPYGSDTYNTAMSCVLSANSYWLTSYACSTNAPMYGGDPSSPVVWPCNPIDFGYYPPAQMPTPRDESMRWGYKRGSYDLWYPDSTQYKNTARSFHYNNLADTRAVVLNNVYDIAGSNIWSPSSYLGLTSSSADNLIRAFTFIEARIRKTEETTYVGFPIQITVNGADISYAPSKVYFHPSVEVSFNYGAVGNTSESGFVYDNIHPPIGGDSKRAGAVKYKMIYPSLELNIEE